MTVRSIFARIPEVEADPGLYPVSTWTQQRYKYWEYWNHFDGIWLDDTVSATDQSLKYPLKLNPFNMPCILHAGFLFGEVQDGADPLVTAVVEPWGRNSSQEKRDQATRMTDLINRVWTENNGRALQQEGGLVAQVLGGCVYGAFFDPSLEEEGSLPIRIDHVMPEYFFPIWSPIRYWELLEAIICFEITQLQAQLMYGVEVSADNALYQEHWKQDSYEITADGKRVKWGGVTLKGQPLTGVPYVYIPHIRAGQFYGISLLHQKDKLAEEINDRFADAGDIVSENARQLPAITNARKVTTRRLDNGVTLLDLGTGIPGTPEPGITYPNGIQVNDPTIRWALELLNLARTEAYTPPVTYGLDEGSQRSSLTLVMRMLPLIVHVRQERTLWTQGLNHLARKVLQIAAKKGIEGITPEMTRNVRIWQEWAPVLPRDHDMEVNELIIRLNAGLISPETALERLGDIRDTQTEMNLIREWLEYSSALNAPAQDPFAGAGAGGEQAGMTRPSAPKPTLTEEE
ncbi:MAG: phage portal protein [Anaerolineae bacterium]|nr:phage portal protein [Anaerolineae bacterium]